MSKYDPLWKYVKENNKDEYKLSFDEVKKIVGFDFDHAFLSFKKELLDYGYEFKKLDLCLPDFVAKSLKEAIPLFDKKMKGFNDKDAILTAIESRSSCPVRITRNDELETSINWIYSAGEGSGYAGGITTSAIDGIKVALKIVNKK